MPAKISNQIHVNMRNILILLLSLNATVGLSQELKATLLPDNQVELEISNPQELWFFIPTSAHEGSFSVETKKEVNYVLGFLLKKDNGLVDCDFSFTHYDYPRDRKKMKHSFGFSGVFSRERNIKFRYSYKYQHYLGDDCKNEEQLYIVFAIYQQNIIKNKFLKRQAAQFFKDHQKAKFFEGELLSNKVLLKH